MKIWKLIFSDFLHIRIGILLSHSTFILPNQTR